jgi:hypothetical protein
MPTATANATAPKARKARAKAARRPAAAKASTTSRPNAAAATQSTPAFGDYAERAVLIQVGAALLARDRMVSTVGDTISNYSSSSRAQAQLRRFERRGATARNRLEREVRKARVRLERELRQRRSVIETRVSHLDDRREAIAKNGTELANKVQERILSLV